VQFAGKIQTPAAIPYTLLTTHQHRKVPLLPVFDVQVRNDKHCYPGQALSAVSAIFRRSAGVAPLTDCTAMPFITVIR
jgi:hypothetical protein